MVEFETPTGCICVGEHTSARGGDSVTFRCVDNSGNSLVIAERALEIVTGLSTQIEQTGDPSVRALAKATHGNESTMRNILRTARERNGIDDTGELLDRVRRFGLLGEEAQNGIEQTRQEPVTRGMTAPGPRGPRGRYRKKQQI